MLRHQLIVLRRRRQGRSGSRTMIAGSSSSCIARHFHRSCRSSRSRARCGGRRPKARSDRVCALANDTGRLWSVRRWSTNDWPRHDSARERGFVLERRLHFIPTQFVRRGRANAALFDSCADPNNGAGLQRHSNTCRTIASTKIASMAVSGQCAFTLVEPAMPPITRLRAREIWIDDALYTA